MNCVVVGLGEFGYAAALSLAEHDVEVIAIDREMSLVESIKNEVSLAVCLDASKKAALAAHGIADADVFIAAIGHNFEAQVLTVVHAAKLGVPRIVARAVTPTHAEILKEVGAHEVLRPEEAAARRLVQGLLIPSVADYFALAEGFSLAEIPMPASLVGKDLQKVDLRSRYRLNVVGIKRPKEKGAGGLEFDPVPDPGRELRSGETLVLVGSDLDIGRLLTETGG
ncbi:MAG: TrkA family potassium uptake protein [Planctomycetes bacterium]|nr:TrkA family potassium uptake protein [Planctomycetota bacterium]MCB9905741.1 TrkA family potassium uptake protein [Planctomycetota bacterium]